MNTFSLMLKAVGASLIALVALLILRGVGSGFATLVKIGGVLLLFGIAFFEISRGVESIRSLVAEFIEAESFVGRSITVMIKALGIALIGKVCADVCKECGEGGLAQGVEAVAGALIFSLSVPILSGILEFAVDVLSRGS